MRNSKKSSTFAAQWLFLRRMKHLVDNSKFTIIDTVALRQTRYLKKYCTFSQLNGEKEEASVTYLKRLVAGEEEELPDRVITMFSELGRAHVGGVSDVQTVGGKQVHISQFVWGRLCVAAYFFYYDEAVWQQVVFGKLEERIIVPELKEELLRAKTLIDEYYQGKGLMTKEGDPSQNPHNRAATIGVHRTPDVLNRGGVWGMDYGEKAVKKIPTSAPKPDDIFAFAYQRTSSYQHLLEFLKAEKEDCTDGEWARYALAIYRHKRVFIKHPSTFKSWLPVFCAMFGRDVNYQEPNKLDRTENQKDIEVFLR